MNDICKATVVVLITSFLILSAGCSDWTDTICAPQYTESGFKRIQVGMGAARVNELVGKPLRTERQEFHDEWIFREKPQKAGSDWGLFSSQELRVPAATHVLFDKSGRLASFYGNYLQGLKVGISKEELKSTFGSPAQIEARPEGIAYVYTRSKHSGSYKQRKIILDSNGRVIDIVSLSYYD